MRLNTRSDAWMRSRARAISLLGIVLVPLAAYEIPYVSPYMSVPIAAALALAMVWAKPGRPATELGLNRPRSMPGSIAIGVTVGLGLFLANRLLLTPSIESLTGTHRDLSAFDYLRGNPQGLLALLPLVWFSAGLCEEVVYRGYMISQPARLLGNSRSARALALVFASILFALAHWHQGFAGMLVTGTVAIVLGLLFLQQRENLWASVAAHVSADTASLVAIAASWDLWLDQAGSALVGR
jgi:membrane protease YdiL (CAAX protease family)